jgi:hypothetical protein
VTSRHQGSQAQQEAVLRAAQVLPPGDRLVGGHQVMAAEQMPVPRRGRRPRVLRGRRMAGDRLAGALFTLTRIVTFQWNLLDAAIEAVEERDRHKGRPFYGGWDSRAGQLTRALFPRTGTGVTQVLLLTDRRIQLAYLQKSRLGGRQGPHTEAGWTAALHEIAWLRDRGDIKGGTHEIGFTDGSWATVLFRGSGWRKFADSFPRKLRHTDPIP